MLLSPWKEGFQCEIYKKIRLLKDHFLIMVTNPFFNSWFSSVRI